jgi:regulator of nucleoside diphosphate kinase
MILLPTAKEAAGYGNHYASAIYTGGMGRPPRKGLVQRQRYAGKILDGGRFHVLEPDRLCSLSEFQSFQLVSKRWSSLSEFERTLLIATFNAQKLSLDSLSPEMAANAWDAASSLYKLGYLRWTDQSCVVELTQVGQLEVQHHLYNLDSDSNLLDTNGGIRIQHHSVQEHEIDLARSSTLCVNVDGMCIRIFTLPNSGTVIRVDHDTSHRIYMSRTDHDRRFAQVYIDRTDRNLSITSGEDSMNNDAICITDLDMQRLQKLLDHPDLMQQKPYVQQLERELNSAVVVPSLKIAANTITMNSTARLIDCETGEEMVLTLVYPHDADISAGRISILAPIGMAILGRKEGETVEWEVPQGKRKLRVDRILYQPEVAGDYTL